MSSKPSLQSSLDPNELGRLVLAQLDVFFPDGRSNDVLLPCVPDALEKLLPSLCTVKLWTPGVFDHLHSSQYCMFLYYLARCLWLKEGCMDVCSKLFGLNKALNGIDLFYEICMPDVFFVGHSIGIVLAKAQYGNYLVLYQNCTVGKSLGKAPEIGDGVILFSNSAVLGDAKIGDHSVLAQGSTVIDQFIPPHSIVFQGSGRYPTIRTCQRPYLDDYFRL